MVKVREKSALVTVEAGKNLAKLRERDFLRPKIYSILLPYFDELQPEADENLQKLLDGLVAAFLTENTIEADEYSEMLGKYLHQFGIRMVKAKFLKLVKFFYEAIIRKDQEHRFIKIACKCLERLFKHVKPGTLGYRDMTLDWRPLYDLYLRSFGRKMSPSPNEWLNKVLVRLAWFYEPTQHAAIWERALEELTIGNEVAMVKFTTMCWSFLSTVGISVDEVKRYAASTWLPELWRMYLRAEMNTSWTVICVDFLADIAIMSPSAFDLSPYYDVLYTKMMRSFNLTARGGKVMVGDGQESTTITNLAQLAAFTIGGPKSSVSHFKRLMHYIQFNVHPMNSGDHQDQIAEFLYQFLSQFKARIKLERLAYEKRKCPKEYYLTDKDIDDVTESMTEVCLMLMFTENNGNDHKVIYVLAAMNREYVAPKMLDHLYSALMAINEPARLTVAIESLYMVIYELIRNPDPEYRAPRAVTYDSTWLRRLEEQRKQWPTYQMGSELADIQKHRPTSLRAHAFYIIEIFANNIDVNDVNRSGCILKTLIILFSSFPLMDFSDAVQHHQMSDDDVIICKLSKRLPHLIEFVLERILQIVTCLSVCPPKSSGGSAGLSMSSEDVHQEGDEETSLKSCIAQCVTVIFERVDEAMRARLFETLFAYVTTSEFSGFLATELLSTIIAASIYLSPDAYKKFAEFVDRKLKELLTEDVQKAKSATSSVMFHVVIGRAVFAAPHQMILENERTICEISGLLLKCQCKKIFKIGMQGVQGLLFSLLTINTEASASPENEKFRRPLNEWNPIAEWAKCIHYKDLTIRWYLPAKPEVDCAQRLLNRFCFPFVEQMRTCSLDRDTLRLYAMYVANVISETTLFEHPKDAENIGDTYTPYQLPYPPSTLGTSCTIDARLTGPNGENARELLLSMVERVVPTTHDPTALSQLAGIAYNCLGRLATKFMDSDLEQSLTDVHQMLKDATYCKIVKASQHTMDELAFFRHAHIEAYHYWGTRHPNTFDRRVLHILTELSLNDYEKVRNVAIACVKRDLTQVFRCRDVIVPRLVEVLTDQTSNNADRVKGAITLMSTTGMMDSVNPKMRLVIWDAVLRMKVMDDVTVCALFDTIVGAIADIDRHSIFKPGDVETAKERNAKVAEIGAQLISPNSPFLTAKSLAAQLATWQQFERSRHTLRTQLVDQLFALYINNKTLHHTREKLARSMAYNAQREAADEKTIRLLLQQLTDEEYAQRYEARSWLLYWLWKSKPPAVKELVASPPKRVDHGVAVESGVREDNLWMVYDSTDLPDTEHKWNRTTFVEKDLGACRWPSNFKATRTRNSGPPLEPKALTPSDQLIIDYFSSPSKVAAFFDVRVIEKEEYTGPSDLVYEVVKYVIRNYPHTSKPLELFTETLKSILNRKPRKEDQLVASELFLGIVLGLKHRTFAEQHTFWSQFTVRLDNFFNEMLGEAEDAWTTVIRQLILCSETDVRRYWWLVESMLAGVKKAKHATDVQQAFRLRCILVKRWRCGEIMNRLVAIAYAKLPFSITDPLRYGIASVLRGATQVQEMNVTATLINVDPRFYPEPLDETIRRLTEHIPLLRPKDLGLTRCSKSAVNLHSPRIAKQRRRSLSPGSAEEKTSNIYMRTLLECILQYYEVSTHSWTPELVKLLPKLMEFGNEDSYELSEETYRNVDITQNSAMITHDYMSVTWLGEHVIDDVVAAWHVAFSVRSWRVRLEVVKFIQASVYSNMFPMCQEARRNAVEKLLFEAIFDENITVRKETAKCLLLFIHCAYITIPEPKIEQLAALLNSSTHAEHFVHGAALGLGAVALAHPFSIPPVILKPLAHLNSSRSRRAFVKNEITSMLREFRRQHRDDWDKVREVIGERLAFDIQNATAPAYYA